MHVWCEAKAFSAHNLGKRFITNYCSRILCETSILCVPWIREHQAGELGEDLNGR
jgi:hypothetical protein